MFNTSNVGKKIARLRKEKNMTQMELADRLSVSYQAVSNWERGNSMPDISKLPELVELLGCSIDSLLSEKKESVLVEHVIKGDAAQFVKEERVSVETLAAAAPVLKPSQTESLMDTVIRDNEELLNTKDLLSIAPFVSEDFLEHWVKKIDVVNNINDLVKLAPYLEEDLLVCLAEKITEEVNISQIVGLAPHLSEETLDKLVIKTVKAGNGKMKDIVGLAPYLSEETLDKVVMSALDNGTIEECTGLYPFLEENTLHKLADKLIKKYGFNAIKGLAPFL
ncbi:helix-turn-helix domain-containing protein [Anaerocolumna sp. MB42-C2]|uniref:helix-turn-helix domain-containing protein n=1 Tax=Anaerocolumna sp. MB42-C2 TaxID=3070997 RepID=UPI0027E0FDAE|nr:helix-turn-helix transcriptional regulator [Anaerocolumna sp. MB42-C2]WMJ86705.1 helix-turn-helix transcriptional regulator [Anaerocolumna sp. MB42-C2]